MQGMRDGSAPSREPGAERRSAEESIERGGGLDVATLLAGALPGSMQPPTVVDVVAAADRSMPAPADVVADTGSSVPAVPDATADAERLAVAIAAAAARFLPGGVLGVDTDFFDAGGTSIHAVELVATLSRDAGVEVDLDEVFADARPRRLAERWLAARGALPTEAPSPSPGVVAPIGADAPPETSAPAVADSDLELILADLALADRLPWAASPERAAPREILLTGATGFLGSHLLLDLLRRGDMHVHCLVRAADEEEGAKRLGAALAQYSLPWSAEIRRRITVLPGDIREPRLGLSSERWEELSSRVDGIVSVAAAVDFLRGYPSLRRSNVIGPLTLAALAATGRPKPLHHVSSIAVFNEVGIASIGEDDPVAHIDRLVAGYDKSKWTAEAALRRARDHGLIVTLLRPGGIGGHPKTGAYNPQDLSSGLLSAFSRLRTVPAFSYLNSAPVDWVSRISAAVICDPDAWGYNYSLAGVPNTLPDVVRGMALGGMHVRVQDWDGWRREALERLEADPVPQLDFLTRVLRSPTALKLCEATLTGPAAGAERTDAFIAARDLPPATRYDAQAQLKTLERLARDGLARLPDRIDPPYLWFPETMEGSLAAVDSPAAAPCSLALNLSIASMYQLVRERRVDVRGELSCALLHPEPVLVESGDVWVRPQEGIPEEHGLSHPLLRYRLALRDRDGRSFWLEGTKYARARRDVWRQTRALTVAVGRAGEPAGWAGEVVVPARSYLREQIDGIRVDPRLSDRERRAAKLVWLAWFGREVGRGLLTPFARLGVDLVDLRRAGYPTRTERNR